MKSVQSYLLLGVAFTALLAFTPVYAAKDDHGHAHEKEAEDAHDHAEEKDEHGHDHGEEEEGVIKLDETQIKAAGINIIAVKTGVLSAEISVPGRIAAAADRMAQIVPKASGTVVEAKKNLGDYVEKGDMLALIESREMAEAAADYLAGKRAEELARTTLKREKTLWDKKVTAEQDYLNARNVHQEAKIRLDLTRQKLQALGHDTDTIKKYEKAGASDTLRFHELKSPLKGRIIARELTLGEYVDTTHTAFTVADLSVVWIEIAISPNDLSVVKEGQVAQVSSGTNRAQGKIVFISPAIDSQTRTAKAIIELDNKDGVWRPGEFANAAIATSSQQAGIVLPKDAIQMVEGKPIVFVRVDKGFETRVVTTGREDSRGIEILSGLSEGDNVAVSGTFTLKAELGKAEAEHVH